jgi:methionine synthase II (cobalamin-independent)
MPGAMLRANAMFRPGLTDRFYPTPADLGADFADMIVDEVRALTAEGLSYFQLDSLLYVRPLPKDQVDASIATDNLVLEAAHQAGVLVGLHMCRGNNRSSWLSEGSYEPNAERAFNELKADRFLLEYDTERAGGFEPLRFVPKGKTVVLGLISTKVPQLETEDALLRRIEEASKYLPLENLAISPQCGFASSMWGNLLSWDEQRSKLELVAKIARKVWS